jgi:outer membrane protein assembly factor BamB
MRRRQYVLWATIAVGITFSVFSASALGESTAIGEYINPLDPDDCLEIHADGTCYMKILEGDTGRWKLENGRISLLFSYGTTLRGTVKDDAILLDWDELLSSTPRVWVKPTKIPPTVVDVSGRYLKAGHPDEYLVLDENGTYAKTERGISGQLHTSFGRWELDRHKVLLHREKIDNYEWPEELTAVVLENHIYFPGLLAKNAWICESREEPTEEEEVPSEEPPEIGPADILKWRYEIRDGVASSPAIGADGTIYVGSDDCYLYALSSDGQLEWRYEIGCCHYLYRDSSPTIGADGTIYVGSAGGLGLYALSPDGQLKWHYEIEGEYGSMYFVESSPAIGADGTIYVGSYDCYLYALSSDGQLEWRYEIGDRDRVKSSPAIGADGTIYMGCDDGLYALSPDGQLKWHYEIGWYHYLFRDSSPTIGADGTIYVGSDDNLFALSPDGQLKWHYEIEGNYVTSSLVVGADSTIYIKARDGYLYALSPDGQLKWRYKIGDNVHSSPAIGADGTIYVGSDDGLYALSPDGQLKWHYKIRYGVKSSLAIGEGGTIYVGGTHLYALNTNSGGLANSAWPMFGHDIRHTHNVSSAQMAHGPSKKEKPNCKIELRKGNSSTSIDTINAGQAFDIYVGDSTDDTGIEEVRFSSDNDQDGNPTGEWTDWCAWDTSSGDWDAETKTMSWAFTTIGEKEVWAEVKDEADQTSQCHADINANPVKEASTKFAVGEYVRVNQAISMWEEPSMDSEALHIFAEKTAGEILQNKGNGVFLNGYHWWYLKASDGFLSYTGWCREKDLEKNSLPNASFTYSPATFKCGQDVTLDASESKDPDGKITVYRWDLDGDGKTDGWTTSPEIIYYWDKPGDHQVTLEVEDDTRGTSKTTKGVTVEKRSIWEKLKDLFRSSPKFSREWLKEIKRELRIKNWGQEIPVYDPDPLNPLYNYSDGDLATVLIQEMDKENNPGVTYGAYILDSIREKKLIEMAASPAWQNEETVNAYFNDLAKINIWAEEGQLLSEEALVGLIGSAGGSGIGVSTVLWIPKLCEVGIGLKALDNTLYREALWNYFTLRMANYDPGAAFAYAKVPYSKSETQGYFESLWETYQEFRNKADFVTAWRTDLQDFLLAALEKYKFYTQIVLLKSAGELRVYDSQNRVTGLVNGEVKQEIPNSIYDEESKTAVISPATDSYRYVVVGVEQGDYGLDAISITSGEATICTVTEMATAIGAVHQYTINWDALGKGETGTTLQVDKNGDGVFEKTYQAGSQLEESQLSTYLVGRTSLWLWIVVGLAIGSVGVVVGGLIWTKILRKS